MAATAGVPSMISRARALAASIIVLLGAFVIDRPADLVRADTGPESATVSGATPQQADTTRNPLETSASAIVDGKRVFDQTCQSCHGPAGEGDRGPALNAGGFAHGNQDGDLFHTIRDGV